MRKVLGLRERMEKGRDSILNDSHPLQIGALFFSKALGLFSSFCSRPRVTGCALATILLNFWLYWINNCKPVPLLLVAHPVAVLRKSYFLALKRIKGLSHCKGGGDKLCGRNFPASVRKVLLVWGSFGTGSLGLERQAWLLWCPLVCSGSGWALWCLISSSESGLTVDEPGSSLYPSINKLLTCFLEAFTRCFTEVLEYL